MTETTEDKVDEKIEEEKEAVVDVAGKFYAIGLNKKVPHIIAVCDTLAQAEVTGQASDAEDFYCVAVEKLAEKFTTGQLVAIFNDLPGEQKVERFSDKATAMKRINSKLIATGGTIMATSKKKVAKKKNGATKKPGGGRKAAARTGKIKALRKTDKRWKSKSFRYALYLLLVDEGSSKLEDFIETAMKKLGKSRGQILGGIEKLLWGKMVEISE